MSMKNTTMHYGKVTIFFHWLIFLLVAIMLPLGYFMGDISDKIVRGEVVNVHKLIGVLVLLLMLLRAMWALTNVKPALPFQTPEWQRLAERTVHFLLYAGLILMPLSGLIGALAAGRPPHLFDVNFDLLPIPLSKPIASFAFGFIHKPLAIILIALISIHILAALYHHFIKRDNILRRILSSRRAY